MTATTTAAARPRPAGPIAPGDWPFNRAKAAAHFTDPRRKVRTPPADLLPATVVAALTAHDTAENLARQATDTAAALRADVDHSQAAHVTEADAALRAGRKPPSDKAVTDLTGQVAAADAAAVTAWEVRGQRAADVYAAAVTARADHLAGHTDRAGNLRRELADLFTRARATLAAIHAEAEAAAWVDTASTAWQPAGARRSTLRPRPFRVPLQLGYRPPRSAVDAIDLAETCITVGLDGTDPAPFRDRERR